MLDGLAQFAGGDTARQRGFRVHRLFADQQGIVQRQNLAPRAIVVHHQIMRQPVEPGRERIAIPRVPADGLPRFQEDLFAQILRLAGIADLVIDIFIDFLDIGMVELRESFLVMLRGALGQFSFIG